MKKFVLDTSILVKWFSKEEGFEEAEKLLKDLEKGKIEIFLPELTKYELGNAFLKGKRLNYTQAKLVLEALYMLPLNFVAEDFKLAKTSYHLAEKFNIAYYDACFLALAKIHKIPLITANPKHQKAIKGIKIISLGV